MAAIDKIYFTKEQGREYWNWLLEHDGKCQELTGKTPSKYFYETQSGYVSNNPELVDWYLWFNCEIEVVADTLLDQYDGPPQNELEGVMAFLQDISEKFGNEKVLSLLESLADEDVSKAAYYKFCKIALG